MAIIKKERSIRTVFFCIIWLLSGLGLTASAAEYKLYINKDQSASNVIVFENTMSAIVTHTSEGMELTLPGVDVALRCKSTNTNNSTDSCVIAIEPGTSTTSGGTTSGGTTSGGTTSGGTTSGGTTSGGTTSGGTTSGGTTSGGTTSGGTTSGGTTSGGSGTCSNTETVTCGSLNYGSAGGNATGNTTRLTVSPSSTLALPFSSQAGSYFGSINIVPTSTPFPSDGSGVRMWWSKEAGGQPLASNECQENLNREGSLWWDQSGQLGYGCPIPSATNTFFLNVRLCISEDSDGACLDSSVKFGSENATIYISGAVNKF